MHYLIAEFDAGRFPLRCAKNTSGALYLQSWNLHDDCFVSRARCLPFNEDSFFPNIALASHVLGVSVVCLLNTHSPQETL